MSAMRFFMPAILSIALTAPSFAVVSTPAFAKHDSDKSVGDRADHAKSHHEKNNHSEPAPAPAPATETTTTTTDPYAEGGVYGPVDGQPYGANMTGTSTTDGTACCANPTTGVTSNGTGQTYDLDVQSAGGTSTVSGPAFSYGTSTDWGTRTVIENDIVEPSSGPDTPSSNPDPDGIGGIP